jgi:hypothetical protein
MTKEEIERYDGQYVRLILSKRPYVVCGHIRALPQAKDHILIQTITGFPAIDPEKVERVEYP